jgi:hypothetical protein
VNPNGSKKWEFAAGNWIISSPAIGPDGTVYVGSFDGRLYAVHSTSAGLAASSWPMFRHDVRHTGLWQEAPAINALFLRKILRRPMLAEKKCVLMQLFVAKRNNFSVRDSIITLTGPGVDAQGVAINAEKRAYKIGWFIFVPVCVEREATVGQWSIQIKTHIESSATVETIVADFQVQ